MRGEMTVDTLSDTIFSGHPEKRFAITTLNPHSRPSLEESLHHAYHQFRADIYIDKFGILGDDARTADGIEFDGDDERAQHFIVVENLEPELSRRCRGTGRAAIVACLRLIDNINNNELPVQTLFGNKGKLKDISGQQALEVSRFISRMSNDLEQLQVVANLFNTGLADANHRRMQAVYGVIEDDLQAKLHSKYKVPTKSLTELQSLEEYNKTKNMAVQIGTRAMTRRIGRDVLEELRLEPGGRRYWDLVA